MMGMVTGLVRSGHRLEDEMWWIILVVWVEWRSIVVFR